MIVAPFGVLEIDPFREWEPVSENDYGPAAPVPIFQHVWEFDLLLDLYQDREPARVLEIGTFHGGSLYHWLTHYGEPELVVAVDSYAAGVDNRALYPEWTAEGTNLVVIEGDSRDPATIEAVAAWGTFDWVWIDAGHYYDEVRSDWEHYGGLAEAGAVIALHDILDHENHPEIEVQRLWREIQRRGWLTQEIVANPENTWGGIGVVYA